MRRKAVVAQTKNVTKLNQAYRRLKDRSSDEGLGLVWGAPGLGKTTGAGELFVREKGILVTAKPGWRQRALLKTLLQELQSDMQFNSNSDMLDAVVNLVTDEQRPIFVDEADFLFSDRASLETLRLIHDVSGAPVLFIGMNSASGSIGIDRRIRRYPQIADRVAEWIEFLPADRDDLLEITATVCDLELADDLLAYILDKTKGNIRRIKTELTQVIHRAGMLKTKQIDLQGYAGKSAANKVAVLRQAEG